MYVVVYSFIPLHLREIQLEKKKKGVLHDYEYYYGCLIAILFFFFFFPSFVTCGNTYL